VSLAVRLVQIRDRPNILAEERASFAARCGLDVAQVRTTNVLAEPVTAEALDGVGALFIGGAGAHSVVETYAWTPSLVALCRLAASRGVPTFGACWGHQFLARAFGGTVVHDPERAEMGTLAVDLTDAGRADPLFEGVPDRFEAQMGHHDRVSVLPPGAVELAQNAVAPYQAFRMADAPVYGAQFHAELDASAQRGRLLAYRAHYPETGDDAAFQTLVDGLRETPHADGLLGRFLTLYAA